MEFLLICYSLPSFLATVPSIFIENGRIKGHDPDDPFYPHLCIPEHLKQQGAQSQDSTSDVVMLDQENPSRRSNRIESISSDSEPLNEQIFNEVAIEVQKVIRDLINRICKEMGDNIAMVEEELDDQVRTPSPLEEEEEGESSSSDDDDSEAEERPKEALKADKWHLAGK